MSILRKLLKWVLILVVAVAVAALVFVWAVLDVNPFEGDVDHLWELVSNDVDFFVRFPGSGLLHEELADNLQDKDGYVWLGDMREALADLTRQVTEQVEVPGDLVDVEFEKDFVGKEMAIAGTMRTDFTQLRFDNFIVLTRVAYYARFVSALKRDFVRERVPDGDKISVQKGYYFRVELDPEAARELARFRTVTTREQPDNIVYLGRIKDVMILSDNHHWIEAAIQGRSATLPADPWFDTEFIRSAEEGRNVELFMRPILSANLMIHHGRAEANGPLSGARRLLPVPMTGEVTVLASPNPKGFDVKLSNNPPPGGFTNVKKLHLQNIYEAEKADLGIDLSENGIARFIPRERTVAALVLHAKAEDLVGLLLDFIPSDDRELLEEGARLRGYRRGFETLLRDELFKDLADTHMLIVHRPPEFEKASFSTFKDPPDVWPPTPEGQFSFSLVSRVRDGVPADKVRAAISRSLPYLSLEPNDPHAHKSGKFYQALPVEEATDLALIKPAYGQLLDNPYIVFSSSVAAAEAIFAAAENSDARLISDPTVATALGRLPRDGTLAMIVRGGMLATAMGDHVRAFAAPILESERSKLRGPIERQNPKKDVDWIDERVKEEMDRFVARRYPELREQYTNGLAWLASVDTLAATWTLGIGPTKQVRASGTIRFAIAE